MLPVRECRAEQCGPPGADRVRGLAPLGQQPVGVRALIAAILTAGPLRRGWAIPTVLGTGVRYTVLTVLEAFHGTDLLGTVPVDMRDRLIHPLLALLAFLAAWLTNRPLARQRTAG